MSSISDIIQSASALSLEEKIAVAKDITNDLYEILDKKGVSRKTTCELIANLFKLFVSADKKTRSQELALFNGMTGLNLDEDTFFNITNYGSDQAFVSKMKELSDSYEDDIAINLVSIGVLILTSDGEITKEEEALLRKICDR